MKGTSSDIIINTLREEYDDLRFSLGLPIINLTDAFYDIMMRLPEDFEGQMYIDRAKQSLKELNEIVGPLEELS